MKVLTVYPQRCTGCRICEQWCAWCHHGAVNPVCARISVQRLPGRAAHVPVACAQCTQAPCIDACPAGAISREPATGGLQLDAAACTGCRLCLESCPRGCIRMDSEDSLPLLCDLCDGAPQCAQHCPEGAIRYEAVEPVDRGYRDAFLAGLAGCEEAP